MSEIDWTSQREYSRSIYESLLEKQTPDKKLVIYPFTVQSLKGGGTGLAYKYVSTGGLFGWFSR